jgi:ornithine decarboxylase
MAEGFDHGRHNIEVVLAEENAPLQNKSKCNIDEFGDNQSKHGDSLKLNFSLALHSPRDVVLKNNLEDIHSAYSSDSETHSCAFTDKEAGTTGSTKSKEVSSSDFYPEYHLDHELSHCVGKDVYDIRDFGSVSAYVNSRIENGLEPASFLITNLAPIAQQFLQWKNELPMVDPFYAVKCNPDPAIIRLLASLGCNFDCATMGEIDLVLNGLGDEYSFGPRGKAAHSIVYANPAKMEHMLRFAVENDVRMTVFDGEDELYKIAAIAGAASFRLLLRLTTDDRASICRFSKKFGCPVDEAPRLLEIAQSLGLHVAGVSFHVGSGCGDADAYVTALEHAKRVFDAAEALGMAPLSIIDVGGGFPGDSGGYGGPGMPSFQDLAAAIRKGIDSFAAQIDRPISEIRFMAEPGRYFVSASTAIVTKIYSRKGGNSDYQALYVDDGVYGSFNNVIYDHATPKPIRLCAAVAAAAHAGDKEIPTAVFGPTCDGLDQMCSLDSTMLAHCNVGEWLLWENMGAYTHTASYVFNGYTHIPPRTYCCL